MRLAVRGVPKGALRTHSAWQAPLWGSLVTCVVCCLRVRQCWGFVSLFLLCVERVLSVLEARVNVCRGLRGRARCVGSPRLCRRRERRLSGARFGRWREERFGRAR